MCGRSVRAGAAGHDAAIAADSGRGLRDAGGRQPPAGTPAITAGASGGVRNVAATAALTGAAGAVAAARAGPGVPVVRRRSR